MLCIVKMDGEKMKKLILKPGTLMKTGLWNQCKEAFLESDSEGVAIK